MTITTDQLARPFHDLLAAAADNAVAAAVAARRRFREYPESDVRQSDIKHIEHEGDRLTGEIVRLLYAEPGDHDVAHDDAYLLASALDDVVDHIEHASDLLGLYKVEAAMAQSLEQCDVLVAAAETLRQAIAQLRDGGDVAATLAQLKGHEDDGDRIVRLAVASLFEHEDISPRVIIQWKDIFDGLEQAIDACERAGHVVGNLLLRRGPRRG
jgi:uncharacterized protein Yka (UPF0111/DUF47 family)